MRTISQPRALCSDIPASQKGVFIHHLLLFWKKKEEQMVSARAIMMQTSKVMICLYIWTTPPLIYMLTIPPCPWVQTGIISLINKVKTETGFAQSWKPLNFYASPWKVLEFSSTLNVVARKVFFDAFWLSKTEREL